MKEATQILGQIEQGDLQATEQLLPLVYTELRRRAESLMVGEAPNTLQPTALVHEAYLRLVDVEHVQHWNSRGHFFMAAAEAMRRIVVERARQRQCLKRGGHMRRHSLLEGDAPHDPRIDDVLDLDATLARLSDVDKRAAKVVELRFFCGMTTEEAANALDISPTSAKRLWTFARAWLRRDMTTDHEDEAGAD